MKTSKRVLVLVLCCLLLASVVLFAVGCSAESSLKSGEKYILNVVANYLKNFKDPSSVRIINAGASGAGYYVEINAKNSWGAYSGSSTYLCSTQHGLIELDADSSDDAELAKLKRDHRTYAAYAFLSSDYDIEKMNKALNERKKKMGY